MPEEYSAMPSSSSVRLTESAWYLACASFSAPVTVMRTRFTVTTRYSTSYVPLTSVLLDVGEQVVDVVLPLAHGVVARGVVRAVSRFELLDRLHARGPQPVHALDVTKEGAAHASSPAQSSVRMTT